MTAHHSLFNRRQIVSALAGLTALPSFAASKLQDEVWTDSARSRDLPVLLRWPEGKAQGVVVYSHGLGGRRDGGDVWGKAWASAGFVVVHVQHPGSDAASLKGGYPALRKAMQPEQFTARVQDVKFIVQEMERRHKTAEAATGSEWAAVPTEKLAIAGHSFGARSTLALAGWQRNGISNPEPRAKAFIALSPALGKDADAAAAQKELAACKRPMLIVSGELDGEVLNNGETAASRRMVFDSLPTGHKALLWLQSADHMTFGGNQKTIPNTMLYRRSDETLQAEPMHHKIVASISAAWLREQLNAQPMQTPAVLGAQDVWLRA